MSGADYPILAVEFGRQRVIGLDGLLGKMHASISGALSSFIGTKRTFRHPCVEIRYRTESGCAACGVSLLGMTQRGHAHAGSPADRQGRSFLALKSFFRGQALKAEKPR